MLDEVAVGDLAQAVPAGETATVGAGQARGRPLRSRRPVREHWVACLRATRLLGISLHGLELPSDDGSVSTPHRERRHKSRRTRRPDS
jgi:hypothetical protein